VGVGTDRLQRQQQKLVTFTSTGGSGTHGFSFMLTPASSIQSLPAGQPAIYILDVVPSGGAFPASATLAYSSNCPPLSTCSLTPAQVSKGSSQKTQVTFTITTSAPVIATLPRTLRLLVYALWLLLPGLIVVFSEARKGCSQRFAFFLLLAVAVPGLWLEIACSSGLQGNGTVEMGMLGRLRGLTP
jgi:hypothetical protein